MSSFDCERSDTEVTPSTSTSTRISQKEVHDNAVNHGWWACPECKGTGLRPYDVTTNSQGTCTTCSGTGKYRNLGESLALIHSEVSEALEARRSKEDDAACTKCNGQSSPIFECPKCQGSGKALGGSRFGEELADIVIRVMDLAEYEGVDLDEVISCKHAYNTSRAYKHGKNF